MNGVTDLLAVLSFFGQQCNVAECSACGASPYCGAEPGCDPMVPPEPVVAQLTFAVDISLLGDTGSRQRRQFEGGFVSDMAAALGIPSGSILVLAVSAGSVRVDFAILPDANFQAVDGGGGQYAYDPADKLVALVQLVADPASSLMTGTTFAALGAPLNVPTMIPAASQGASEKLATDTDAPLHALSATPSTDVY